MKVRKNYAQTTSKASTDHEELYERKFDRMIPDCAQDFVFCFHMILPFVLLLQC